MSNLLNYKDISYKDEVAPFDTYLLVHTEDGYSVKAYEISENSPPDIDVLLLEALEKEYSGYSITLETTKQNGGSNYAAIITDSRIPASPIVWNSCDFYYTIN